MFKESPSSLTTGLRCVIRNLVIGSACFLLCLAAQANYLCYSASSNPCARAGTCIENCKKKICDYHGGSFTINMGTFLLYDVPQPKVVLVENESGTSRKKAETPSALVYRVSDPENNCTYNYEEGISVSMTQCAGEVPDGNYPCP